MKVAICLQCDNRMKELTNLVWCEACNLTVDKEQIFSGTVKTQTWEMRIWSTSIFWARIPPYEKWTRRKNPKEGAFEVHSPSNWPRSRMPHGGL